MESYRTLRERSLEELLWSVMASRREGLVALRDRDGLRHGVWTHRGFVVGIHVAGRFDPLLDTLRKRGSLDERSYRSCVESLHEPGARSGSLAVELGGAPRQDVREALKEQSRARMAALLSVAEQRGHDARFEPCAVPPGEISIRMPLGALLLPRGVDGAPPATRAHDLRADARRRLREVARRLHPDLHGHLDEPTRKQLERDLAAATAAYHGLG